MLNFEEFKDYVKEHIREYLPEYLSDAEISMQTTQKNNGLELDGITVRHKDSNLALMVYLEQYYMKYFTNGRINSIMEEIAEVCSENQTYGRFMNIGEYFRDFEFIKDNIIMVAVNAESNKKLLEDTPHVIKEDLALIYKVLVEKSSSGIGTVTVKNQHMNMWGVNIDTINALAKENSRRLFPAVVKNMNDILIEMMPKYMPDDMCELLEECVPETKRMYVISNECRINGASVLFYDEDAIAELADKLESDLYILPSSIHETIAVSADAWKPEQLAEMVLEVNNSQVEPEEQLSNNVYHYNAASHTLSLTDVQAPELFRDKEVNQMR